MDPTIAFVSLCFQIVLCVVFVLNYQMNRRTFYASNYNQLVSLLQREDVRESRRYVQEELCHKDYGQNEWSKKDVEHAKRVCGAYGNVGIHLEKGLVRLKDIDGYHTNLLKCYNAVSPFIANQMAPDNTQSWEHFSYVFERIKRHRPNLEA